jgi:molecular chaperone GrpE
MVKIKKEHTDKHGHSGELHAEKVVADDHTKENVDLKKILEEKEKEVTANYDKYLRAVAELDNYKKRAAKEKVDTIKYGNEELIRDILPFVDSLDRAMEHTGGSDVDAFKDGLKLIQEQLLCCLKKHGVEKIESTGLDFDPSFHEAMMQSDSEKHEENKIINELQKGYLLNGRLLRPSKVCVCKKINKENDVCEQIADNGE